MPSWVHDVNRFRAAVAAVCAATLALPPLPAQTTKPTGAPLVLSTVETEQPIPLAILAPDGKTAKCVPVRLHWNPNLAVGPNDDNASFTLDLPAGDPTGPIFMAQLWNASLASAMAWQQPWQGARWKILDTPDADGTGIDAALAVGMIATSARRPYPVDTLVLGSLNPDGSLGPVSRIIDRMDAAASAGIKRVVIPSCQRFDTDSTGQVVNIVRHASDLQLKCIPVDDLVTATETVMNDPLPAATLDSSVPKYSNDVASYIDGFAQREQTEVTNGLQFAPKETDLGTYLPHQAAIWKSVYADYDAGQEAYRAGQVYVAYQLFTRANGRMNGANALAGQTRASFDVKEALVESDELHDRLHVLMTPPAIDQDGLQSSLLVSEMADWAFTINAALEGAQLLTKQTFSQRSDATDAEKDRAREAILFANAQCKYLLTQVDFYTGLLDHLAKENPTPVDQNASQLLPQLIPAQLATARSFTAGIRASDLRDGLLFDPRLVAYVNVLRDIKTDWDSRQHDKANLEATPPTAAPTTGTNIDAAPVKPDATGTGSVGFDPGDTYMPPHGAVSSATPTRKVSDPALCLIWANHDCEIATLDEKYLRLAGSMDPTTHDWHVKDRAKLDAMLQTAEVGARRGISLAEMAQLDPSVLAMIYERAAHQRTQNDDAAALDALRNYWRCALLGNMCWQLAHTHKAQPVDLGTAAPSDDKGQKSGATKTDSSTKTDTATAPSTPSTPAATTNAAVVVTPPTTPSAPATHDIVTPAPSTNSTVVVIPPTPTPAPTPAPETPAVTPAITPDIPVAPVANHDATPLITPAPSVPPAAPSTEVHATIAVDPPVAPIATNMDNIPVAPIAHEADVPSPPLVVDPPVVPIATNAEVTPAAPTPQPPAPQPATTNSAPVAVVPAAPADPEANIPVAPIAKVEDYANESGTTNAPPVNAPIPAAPKQGDNSDAHSF